MKTIESALADDHMRHVNGDLLGTLELIDAAAARAERGRIGGPGYAIYIGA